MATATLEQAYPGISFRWRSRNWWARLMRVPPECVHLEHEFSWMATYSPDTLYLQGKATKQRQPARPEVSLCRNCLVHELQSELASYRGRVIAFEPDSAELSQYFFVGKPDFAAAGLRPEVGEAIASRLRESLGECEECRAPARWLWVSRAQVDSLDDIGSIVSAQGLRLCAMHGARRLCDTFAAISEANLMYVNVPYGEAGAYVWF
jgi:hypothetical protein